MIIDDTNNYIGNFEDFLFKLRTYESGINPEKFDWYIDNLNKPTINYPQTDNSGRAIRDCDTGEILYKYTTIKEYFASLRVKHLFDTSNKNSLTLMQYKVINPLGFVGYQVGEAILISTGYYLPEKKTIYYNNKMIECPRYYFGGVKVESWANGNTEIIYQIPDTNTVIMATDVNYWKGFFTGKDEIYCLDDLMTEEKQEKVIRVIIKYNYDLIKQSFIANNFPGIFSKGWIESNESYTISGVLAAAHLVGAIGTINFLKANIPAQDEFGTHIKKYLKDFSYYRIIF